MEMGAQDMQHWVFMYLQHRVWEKTAAPQFVHTWVVWQALLSTAGVCLLSRQGRVIPGWEHLLDFGRVIEPLLYLSVKQGRLRLPQAMELRMTRGWVRF